MQTILDFLIWSPDPDIFKIPLSFLGFEDRPVRWYGLLFAGGFILSQQVLMWIFKQEGRPEKTVDKLTLYMVTATIIGARLGHCLFYNPGYYLSNPIEIIKVWEGGLASHGGAIGILIALWLFARKYKEYRLMWILDRMVIVVALTGAMIRTGNFFNSEMEGVTTNSTTGVVYARFTEDVLNYDERIESITFSMGGQMESNEPGKYPITATIKFERGQQLGERDKQFVESRLRNALLSYDEVTQHIDFGQDKPLAYRVYQERNHWYIDIYGIGIVRHAAQLYEAGYCLFFMVLLFWLWKEKRLVLPEGFNFALFMMLLWSFRFVDEFFKMNQEAFEESIPLNMGQWLSIPLFLVGAFLMFRAYNDKKLNMAGEPFSKP
ncbi:MAG: prolipoprotein diacylglyceryl transferase [Cyclobacteriaceae bacterium]